MRKILVCLCIMIVIAQMFPYTPPVSAAPTDLKVYAEAASFARLDNIDPSGWFYQAVLYNPTDTDIVVTGLRWWYNASAAKLIDGGRDARCYDSRYFSALPITWNPSDRNIRWEYNPSSISINVPAKKMILTWIEVPTYSVNNDGVLTNYFVQAYAGDQWISSPLYISHSGHDNSASTVFRADFDLASDPNSELQNHPNPQWLFKENRSVVAGLSTRVRVIPIASSRSSLGINFATVNVTLPSGWSYVSGSANNPYGETITYYSVSGQDRLKWDLNRDVSKYSNNQSMAQNYIEFNVTAPSTPGIYNFTVTSLITSLSARTTVENQYIYVVVKTPPTAALTFSQAKPLVNQSVTFNASYSSDLDGTIVDYSWDFGDGQTANGMIVSHAYTSLGNYWVTLTATDNDGLKGTASVNIQVIKNPVASFTFSPMSPLVNVTVTFNASLSTPNGGSIADYLWDFGDSATGSGVTVTHSYTNFGNYTVTLTIIDSEGLNDSETRIIRIGASPLAAFTYSPEQPWVSTTVTFNASSSQDFDGSIAAYEWDFGDSTLTVVFNPIVSHVYNSSGSFTVILRVFDNDGFNGSSSKTLTVVIHNVAILSVSPSATEVQTSQQINVTVMVKNKGTTTETFNVTVYYNNTKLETQSVVNLAPGAETILIFTWNTAGLAEGATYTLRAETSEIQGETDTTDNNLTEGIVKISLSPPTPATPTGFWDTVLPYAIPIGAAIASILLLAVVTVLRKSSKQAASPVEAAPSESQLFTDMTGGELPDAYSVMIVGDTSAGKSVLCQQLTRKYLNQGKPCIYVTYDCFPEEVRRNMQDFGWDVSTHEQNGVFAFVDCYSSTAGKASQEKYYVKQPFALSELGIAISVAMSELEQKSPRVFLDSAVPLFTRLEPAKVAEFLQDRSAQVKGENGVFFFTIGRGTIPQDLQRRLEEIVDCIIDLEVHEQKGEMTRGLRIRKLRGRPFSDQWVSFQIDMKRGFVLSVPKHSSKSQK